MCGYSDAYIVVKGRIGILAVAPNEHDKTQKDVVFRNNPPFMSWISKTNTTLLDNAEDLDILMPMYNLLEYGHSYFMKSGSF